MHMRYDHPSWIKADIRNRDQDAILEYQEVLFDGLVQNCSISSELEMEMLHLHYNDVIMSAMAS